MFSIFKKYPKLIVALSEKSDGSMKINGEEARQKRVLENRKNFLAKFNIASNQIITPELVHGKRIRVVDDKNKRKSIRKTDGLITKKPNVFLTITVADCLPVFIYDPVKKVVGLIHAGWRGLENQILKSAIDKISQEFGCNENNILVGIGPGISKCHFEVGREVLNKFKPFLRQCSEKRDGKNFLNLKKIAKIQLLEIGLKEKNIEINQECTFCETKKYFSYRRQKNRNKKRKPTNTAVAVIGIKND